MCRIGRSFATKAEMMRWIASLTTRSQSYVELSLGLNTLIPYREPRGVETVCDPEGIVAKAFRSVRKHGRRVSGRPLKTIQRFADAMADAHITPPDVLRKPPKDLIDLWDDIPGYRDFYNRFMRVQIEDRARDVAIRKHTHSGSCVYVASPMTYDDGEEIISALAGCQGSALVLLRNGEEIPPELAHFTPLKIGVECFCMTLLCSLGGVEAER